MEKISILVSFEEGIWFIIKFFDVGGKYWSWLNGNNNCLGTLHEAWATVWAVGVQFAI